MRQRPIPASKSLPAVCILAGGRGTRLGDIARETPKALIKVASEPFIFHQLRLLATHGARRIVLCVGHQGDLIERAVGRGSSFGVEVYYAYDPPGTTGTATAIRAALPLVGDHFLVLYGDTYLRIDYRDFATSFLHHELPAQMAVLHNDGRWGASNADFDGDLVVRFDKFSPRPAMCWIDYGLGAFRREVFDARPGNDATDLAEVYAGLAATGRLAGYVATQRFFEIGTPESLAETDAFLRALLNRA